MSIHCNAGGGHGAETYYFYGSQAEHQLAEDIQYQLVNSLPLNNRGIKQKGFAVLSDTDCPAALVETAFIDSASDARLLVEREDDFTAAIAHGITDFTAANPLPDVIYRKKIKPVSLPKRAVLAETLWHFVAVDCKSIRR